MLEASQNDCEGSGVTEGEGAGKGRGVKDRDGEDTTDRFDCSLKGVGCGFGGSFRLKTSQEEVSVFNAVIGGLGPIVDESRVQFDAWLNA